MRSMLTPEQAAAYEAGLAKLGVPAIPQATPYYEPPAGVTVPGVEPPLTLPAPAGPPAGPVYGQPIPPEQLPPGAVIAPGPPVPIESLPLPQ